MSFELMSSPQMPVARLHNIKRVAGIYHIKNIVNNKLYIGSASYIKNRLNWHKNSLIKNKHHSILLQRAWNKYGSEVFEFNIIEEVEDKSKLIEIEQKYLDLYRCYDPSLGYNIYNIAGSSLGRKHTEEAKDKIRKWAETANYSHSDEIKSKIKKYQSNRTPEHKANHKLAMKNRIMTEEHKLKLKLANAKRNWKKLVGQKDMEPW